ncbi:HU family DNA-binding protein [Haliovirga abyssi]|uniref:HU family DNA-binding protein n=1 Tax=Haliovirga abyssi TaxID=2996794 RepID=A0AAU9DNK2_9FUSO|nr:HU family DNA-binding protein [Haliovirga abyssi]BDU49933.1 hypothetical protein HLVA_05020 [Haliovirga abyssi]
MIKKEFIARLSAKLGERRDRTYEVVESFWETLGECLEEDGELKLSSYGVFKVKETVERNVKHPTTKEIIIIPKKNVIKFYASNKLKMKINNDSKKSNSKKRFSIKDVMKKIPNIFGKKI